MGGTASHAASGWQTQFAGLPVTSVAVNQQRTAELAAVVNGQLKLSRDGGITWNDSWLPLTPTTISYDPATLGRLYAGTTAGLYVSADDGLSWRLLDTTVTTHKLVAATYADSQYVFAAMYDGAGTPIRVYRFDSAYNLVDTNLPSGNATSFDYDYGRHRLYVGAAGGVYYSDDEGTTWSGGGGGAGQYSVKVAVKLDAIWQTSADGLFRSYDGITWNKLAGPGDLNKTYYGSDMRLSGLVINHGTAFYGAWSPGYPYTFLAEYSGGSATSILNVQVNDLVDDSTRLWAATPNGLLVSDPNTLTSSEAMVRRPVIVIPGILGSLPTVSGLAHYFSTEAEGFWDHSYKTPLVLDPVDHTYDGLMQSLQDHGYKLNQTLFAFPYNWMQDNAITAGQLSQKISDVKAICGCGQVDIVAHSMGGLVARSYIEGDRYGNDIQDFIELATPNLGATEAYAAWEGGQDPDLNGQSSGGLLHAVVSALLDSHFAAERVVAVQRFVPALGQLLPIYDYIGGRHYPDNYPRNAFLDDLDQPERLAAVRQRTAVYTIGANNRSTPLSITVSQPNPGAALWRDGAITASATDSGDGTVLASSLTSLIAASAWLDADHGGVVTAAAPTVERILMGGAVDDDPIKPPPPSAATIIYASGPVALRFTDSSGQVVDDNAIAIKGAFYTGSGTVPQILTLPLPSAPAPDNHDQLTVIGTGSGSYSIGAITPSAASAPDLGDEPGSSTSDTGGAITAGQEITYSYDPAANSLTPELPTTSASSMANLGSDLVVSGATTSPGTLHVGDLAISAHLAAPSLGSVSHHLAHRRSLFRPRHQVKTWRWRHRVRVLGLAALFILLIAGSLFSAKRLRL